MFATPLDIVLIASDKPMAAGIFVVLEKKTYAILLFSLMFRYYYVIRLILNIFNVITIISASITNIFPDLLIQLLLYYKLLIQN